MENKKHFCCVGFLFLLMGIVNGMVVKDQGQSLSKLYKAKLNVNSLVDTSFFDTKHHQQININEKKLSQDGLKEKDKIDRLPGQPKVNFAQYGGYVSVDQSAGRALYYYFVQAPHHYQSLPLLIWLNGGPGCSSLAYGAMQELGPFRVRSDGKTLFRNKYSWNNVANVLFIESPAGVGFSYSNRTSDYEKSGDRNTATDNYVFLVNWLDRFPEYKGRDLYISGESYAGHYVPQFAHNILYHENSDINLKGIIIGNAVINDETDNRGMYDYLETHALISEETANQIRKYCNFSVENQSIKCDNASDEAGIDVSELDIYSIYAPTCLNTSLISKPKRTCGMLTIDPCSDYYVYAYLNRGDVQEAMHANVTKLSHDWEPCSDIIQHWNDSPSTIIPLLKELMANDRRVWIFSGDTDGRVPVTSTKYSINKMKLTTKSLWRPWLHEDEVGGFIQEYEGNLTFVTVRGAGHQVPSYQPSRALALIKHFLAGSPLPKSPKHD